MFYVTCPNCEAQVEIPSEAVGPSRTRGTSRIVTSAGNSFDFDDEEVLETPDAP